MNESRDIALIDELRAQPQKNAAQATTAINKTLQAKLIREADPDHPRAGYVPHWA